MRLKPTKGGMANIKKYFLKSVLTIILVISSFFCFTYSVKEIEQKEIQISNTFKKVKTTEDEGLKNFLEYIGLFLLVLAAWQWRKELSFDSIGILSKQPDINNQDPRNKPVNPEDIPPPPPVSTTTTTTTQPPSDKGFEDFRDFINTEILDRILLLMRENPNSITNASILANKLGLSQKDVERFLFELMREKLIRKDIYPGSKNPIYSLTNSFDNLAMDYFIDNIKESEEIFGDYRYVKIKNKYEIDAIIKTNKTNYIIETKFIKEYNLSAIHRGIQQLLKVEEEINLLPTTLTLIIVGTKENLELIENDRFLIKDNLIIIKIDIEKITMPNKV
jgi:hypothetical protein